MSDLSTVASVSAARPTLAATEARPTTPRPPVADAVSPALSAWVAARQERVRVDHEGLLGRPVAAAPTPALVIDRTVLDANLSRMDAALDDTGATIRPHVKTHKSAEIARRQQTPHAHGFCTATVWEAAMLIGSGLDDIFVVNAVVAPQPLAVLALLAREHTVAVAVDDQAQIRRLAAAAEVAGSTIGVLVEIDTGMRRGGVVTAADAVALARTIDAEPRLDLRGVTGYEGHCSAQPDPVVRASWQREAMAMLLAVVDTVRAASLPCPVVSAGGTRTWAATSATPGITEIQAGSYALMDRFHHDAPGGFQPALSISTTVVNRHLDRLVVDVGSKTVGDSELAIITGSDLVNLGFDEEHGRFTAPPDDSLPIGTVLQLLPGYTPTTINAFDAYLVAEDGIVVDVWPILPRTPGDRGLLAALARAGCAVA